jgi:hypothetical protein
MVEGLRASRRKKWQTGRYGPAPARTMTASRAGADWYYFSSVFRRNPVRDCAAAIMNDASWPERMNLAPIAM